MAWSKRDFVKQAYDSLGYASYDFDLEPEQMQSALRLLDSMMAGTGFKDLPYPLPANPSDSDLDEDSSVPSIANEAVYLGLAIRLAPSLGKVPSQELKQVARSSYKELLNFVATMPVQSQIPMPAGAGHRADDCSQYIGEIKNQNCG